MAEVIRVHAQTTSRDVVHPRWGSIRQISVTMHDETGRRLEDGEMLALHNAGRAAGYCVKLRAECLDVAPGFPLLTIVGDARPDEGRVLIGETWLPLDEFHRLYEID